MNPRRPTFAEGERVRFGASTVAVVRSRFLADGAEHVDVRYLCGLDAGFVTTVRAEKLRRVPPRREAVA